ncbi:MAG: hypothetical protein AB7K09_07720 [Planctomycetota bacterium]
MKAIDVDSDGELDLQVDSVSHTITLRPVSGDRRTRPTEKMPAAADRQTAFGGALEAYRVLHEDAGGVLIVQVNHGNRAVRERLLKNTPGLPARVMAAVDRYERSAIVAQKYLAQLARAYESHFAGNRVRFVESAE